MNTNIKKIALLGMLVALTGAQCWSAATDTRLFEAVTKDDAEEVQRLLKTGANVNTTNNNNFTPLMKAALFASYQVIPILLNAGADINAKGTPQNRTSLKIAAEMGHLQVIKSLLNAGADINATDDLLETPLMAAAQHGYAIIVQALLQRAAIDVNAIDHQGNTALIWAATNGYATIVQMLLAANADADIRNNPGFQDPGQTALEIAQQNRDRPTINALTGWVPLGG